jgi:hypothetical protein
MQKQVNRPFINRYLKRDDILQAIQGCDAELNNALNMFSVCLLSLPRVSSDSFFLGTAFHPNPYSTPDPGLGQTAASGNGDPHLRDEGKNPTPRHGHRTCCVPCYRPSPPKLQMGILRLKTT